MRQVHPVSQFDMAQSELLEQCYEKHQVMTRDAADLAGRGADAARVARFRNQADAFAALPTDIELDAAKQEATARKTAIRTQALTQLQGIMGIVGTVHDPRTATYKMFGSAGLGNGSDAELYVGLLRVVRVGRARLADFASAGLTPAMLDALAASTADLRTREDEQEDAEATRGQAADNRVLAANALYAELMAICSIGKALYAQTDARKFHDYVVNETPAPGAPPVPPAA